MEALVRYLWLLRKISVCEVNFRFLGFQIRDFSKVGFKLLIGFDWRKLWLNWMYGIVYEPYGWLWLIVMRIGIWMVGWKCVKFRGYAVQFLRVCVCFEFELILIHFMEILVIWTLGGLSSILVIFPDFIYVISSLICHVYE